MNNGYKTKGNGAKIDRSHRKARTQKQIPEILKYHLAKDREIRRKKGLEKKLSNQYKMVA